MEGIIITVRISAGHEYDAEVMPDVPCRELAGQIVCAIREKDPDVARHIGENPFLSAADGRRFADGATLAEMGLWDGSIIILGSDSL